MIMVTNNGAVQLMLSPQNGTPRQEKPRHLKYLNEFRTRQCLLFLEQQCQYHRPYTCFHWHFPNQKRRRPFKRHDGTFNYNPDVYCDKYDETSGSCADGDECPYAHRNAGDTERRYHPRYFKTGNCIYETLDNGACVKNGLHCAFAHGPDDIRLPVYDIREIQDASSKFTVNLPASLEKERVLSEDPKWNEMFHVLACYKTELCKKPPRMCRQGYSCPFYHNGKDKRRAPDKFLYRSTPCPIVRPGDEWQDSGLCETGDACIYCHTRTEQQFHPEIYKSTKCNDVLNSGYCPRGPFCAFAHCDNEMSIGRDFLSNLQQAQCFNSDFHFDSKNLSGPTTAPVAIAASTPVSARYYHRQSHHADVSSHSNVATLPPNLMSLVQPQLSPAQKFLSPSHQLVVGFPSPSTNELKKPVVGINEHHGRLANFQSPQVSSSNCIASALTTITTGLPHLPAPAIIPSPTTATSLRGRRVTRCSSPRTNSMWPSLAAIGDNRSSSSHLAALMQNSSLTALGMQIPDNLINSTTNLRNRSTPNQPQGVLAHSLATNACGRDKGRHRSGGSVPSAEISSTWRDLTSPSSGFMLPNPNLNTTSTSTYPGRCGSIIGNTNGQFVGRQSSKQHQTGSLLHNNSCVNTKVLGTSKYPLAANHDVLHINHSGLFTVNNTSSLHGSQYSTEVTDSSIHSLIFPNDTCFSTDNNIYSTEQYFSPNLPWSMNVDSGNNSGIGDTESDLGNFFDNNPQTGGPSSVVVSTAAANKIMFGFNDDTNRDSGLVMDMNFTSPLEHGVVVNRGFKKGLDSTCEFQRMFHQQNFGRPVSEDPEFHVTSSSTISHLDASNPVTIPRKSNKNFKEFHATIFDDRMCQLTTTCGNLKQSIWPSTGPDASLTDHLYHHHQQQSSQPPSFCPVVGSPIHATSGLGLVAHHSVGSAAGSSSNSSTGLPFGNPLKLTNNATMMDISAPYSQTPYALQISNTVVNTTAAITVNGIHTISNTSVLLSDNNQSNVGQTRFTASHDFTNLPQSPILLPSPFSNPGCDLERLTLRKELNEVRQRLDTKEGEVEALKRQRDFVTEHLRDSLGVIRQLFHSLHLSSSNTDLCQPLFVDTENIGNTTANTCMSSNHVLDTQAGSVVDAIATTVTTTNSVKPCLFTSPLSSIDTSELRKEQSFLSEQVSPDKNQDSHLSFIDSNDSTDQRHHLLQLEQQQALAALFANPLVAALLNTNTLNSNESNVVTTAIPHSTTTEHSLNQLTTTNDASIGITTNLQFLDWNLSGNSFVLHEENYETSIDPSHSLSGLDDTAQSNRQNEDSDVEELFSATSGLLPLPHENSNKSLFYDQFDATDLDNDSKTINHSTAIFGEHDGTNNLDWFNSDLHWHNNENHDGTQK